MIEAPIIDRLPDEYLRLIGEVVTSWALLELALRRTTFAMLDLSEPEGRTAVRTPRAKEMVEMICELALIHGFAVEVGGLAGIDAIESRRNLVAHSVWLKSPSGLPMIQNVQGMWSKEVNRPRIKKRFQPEGIETKPHDLRGLVQDIRTLTLNTYDVAQAIAKRLASSPRKRRGPPPPAGHPKK